MKKQLLKTMLLVAVGLLVGMSSAWADTTLFSAEATAALSVPASTSNQAITSTNATISGGTMYVYNGQTEAKNLISAASGTQGFTITNSNTFFKVTLSSALEEGDKINFITYNNDKSNSAERGLWFTSTEGYPASAPTAKKTETIASQSWSDNLTYTVASGDGICGENTFYIYRAVGKTSYFTNFTVTRAAVAPGAVSFSPAAGTVAAGTSITLTSSGATTIVYQWGAAAVDGEGDWSSATTYSGSSKPVVPAVGSTNTVLSVKASNANGDTYGSASYTPVKMALKTIYSFADGIGSQTKTADDATIAAPTSMSLSSSGGRIKLTAAAGFEFENGDAIEISGSIGNTSKKYGIKYGPNTSINAGDLYVAAGQPCHASGTLTLAEATGDLYIGRYDGTTTSFATFTVRRQTAATSEAFTGAVKINGSAATEDEDYTKEGNVYTLTAEYSTMPTVCLVNHIVFADASEEDQNVLVAFGNPDGTYFTGTAVIDGTTYTVKAPCGQINALKVVYKDGGTTVKEENLDVTGLKIGASYTVPFRMYVENTGALYKTTANGSTYYGEAVTLEYNTTVTKSVSSVDLGGGTLVLLEDLDDSGDNGASTRASNCSAYINKAYTSASNLPAGKYNFIFRVENINNRGSYIKVGDTEVYQTNSRDKGAWNDVEVNNVIIPTAGALTLAKSGSAYDGYDILIAIRTGDATVSKSISSAGWATYCSPYALDFSGDITNLTDAYIVTGGATGVLAKTSVKGGKVAANTGLLIKGDAGTATIPVVASGTDYSATNKLVGVTTETVLDLDSNDDGTPDSYVYVLMNDATNGLGFYQTTTTSFTVGANTAYLPANFDGSGARFFSLFDDATGINAVNGEESMVNGSVFNLAGQRVAQPTKGLYILNGKKVIIK